MSSRRSGQSIDSVLDNQEEDQADHITRPRLRPPTELIVPIIEKPIQGQQRDVVDAISLENLQIDKAPGDTVAPNLSQDTIATNTLGDTVEHEGNTVPITKQKITEHFLDACSDGNIEKLQNDIIPEINHNAGFDVCELTNNESYTATGLHLALLNHHGKTADFLMDEFGEKLILQKYVHSENLGLTALHLAITQNMVEQVQKMMDHLFSESKKCAFIHAECTGSFFKSEWNISSVPLTLALLCKNREIVELLLKAGADCKHSSKQCNGETILHSLARHSLACPEDAEIQLGILTDVLASRSQRKYGYCKEMKDLLQVPDDDGLTPFAFGLKIGASSFVQALLDIPWVYKMPQWNYNPLQVSIYDVTDFKKKQQPWNISGLELLAFSKDKKMLQLYKKEPIRTMVEEVWQQYAYLHVISGIVHLIYMILFSVGVMSKHILQRPVKPAAHEKGWVVALCVILALMSLSWSIMAIIDVVTYFLPLCSRKKYIKMLNNEKAGFNNRCSDAERGNDIKLVPNHHTGNANDQQSYKPPAQKSSKISRKLSVIPPKLLLRFNTCKVMYFILDVFIFAWSIMRLTGHEYEATVAVFPLLLGWYSCIYYSIFFEKIFVFMLMLNNMLMSNILYFAIALAFILVGFGTAFGSLQDPTKMDAHDMFPFWRLLNTLFRQMLALNDIDELMDSFKFPKCARLVMLAFFVIATVLLLNTLIAAMTDTYAEVKGHKVALWYRVKLQMALQVDRPTFKCIRCILHKPQKLQKKDKRYLLDVHVIKKN